MEQQTFPRATGDATVLEFARDLKTCASRAALMNIMRRIAYHYSLASYAIGGVPMPETLARDYALLSGWPAEWFDLYMTTDRWTYDPVFQTTMRSTEAVVWAKDVPVETGSPGERLMGEARDFGLRDGVTLPVVHLTGMQSIVSFYTDKVMLGDEECLALQLLASFIIDACVRHAPTDGSIGRLHHRLTDRQRQCLAGAAQGMTTRMIAERLDLRPATVRWHIEQAFEQLGAKTRAEAIHLARSHAISLPPI